MSDKRIENVLVFPEEFIDEDLKKIEKILKESKNFKEDMKNLFRMTPPEADKRLKIK